MNEHIRALNLSNTAAILVYEALTTTIIFRFKIKKRDCLLGKSHFFMLADVPFFTFCFVPGLSSYPPVKIADKERKAYTQDKNKIH